MCVLENGADKILPSSQILQSGCRLVITHCVKSYDWLKARDQSTSVSICIGSINHAEDERRMMEEKRVKTEICTFFKLQRRGITFSRS